MYKLKNNKLTNLIGGISCLSLLSLAFFAITPPAIDSASAEELQVSVAVHDYLKVALSTTALNLDVTPSIDGSFVTSDSDVTMKVETNNPTGYKLYMSTQDNQTALVNVTGDKIESIAGSKVASSDFPMNTWGYQMAIGDATSSTYDSIPSTITTLDSARKAEETYKFNFGIKVNAEKSGTYANTLVLSAVASPTELSTLTDLTYMQDMTSTICQNTAVNDDGKNPVTKQLIDIRDGKSYWVSKLKDDNCWMVQNLALDIPAEGLKAVDTDIETDWTNPSGATITEADFSQDTDSTNTYSWNLGKYVLATPTTGVTCNSSPTAESNSNDGWNSVRPNQSLSQCQNVVDVSGVNWTPTYTAQEGVWFSPVYSDAFSKYLYPAGTVGALTTQTIVSVKPNDYNGLSKGGEYDAHYLLGNYYQWNTATAGSGGEIVSSGTEGDNANFIPNNAKDSICPKNWQLPTADSGVARNATDIANIGNYTEKYGKTFTKLFTSYGYEFPNSMMPSIYGSNEQNNYDIVATPFYFSRAGFVAFSTESLKNVGHTSLSRSSLAGTSTSNAYYLGFNSNDAYPSYSHGRQDGFPVRCLAR